MKLSPLASLAIFMGILLGALAGAGAIYNHVFPSGQEKLDLKVDKLDHTKDIGRLEAADRDHGAKITDLERRMAHGEKRQDGAERDISALQGQQKQTQEQLDAAKTDIVALKDASGKQVEQIASLTRDNDMLRKSQEMLQKETQDKLDKMRKEQSTQDERIKRMERLLGLEAEN